MSSKHHAYTHYFIQEIGYSGSCVVDIAFHSLSRRLTSKCFATCMCYQLVTHIRSDVRVYYIQISLVPRQAIKAVWRPGNEAISKAG